MLGWSTVHGTMDQMKMNFVWKLASMRPDTLTKQIFLCEMYSCLLSTLSCQNITSDLIDVLNKYRMLDNFKIYLQGGTLPGKKDWKILVRESVMLHEHSKWQHELQSKGAFRYQRVQPVLAPNHLYDIIRRNLNMKDSIMILVNLLSL